VHLRSRIRGGGGERRDYESPRYSLGVKGFCVDRGENGACGEEKICTTTNIYRNTTFTEARSMY